MKQSDHKTEKMSGRLAENKNMLFLAASLAVRIVYACVFLALGIQALGFLLMAGSCFYCMLLFRNKNERSIDYACAEILLFSVLCELTLGRGFGFYLYIVEMAAAVFYLLPSGGIKRFVYQIAGIAASLAVEWIVLALGMCAEDIRAAALPYQMAFYLANLGVTSSIVLASTIFYSRETEKIRRSLEYSINHDVLTGLYNRRFFESRIEALAENERSRYVIAMVDIDFFKKVNDTYGHEAGDSVLAGVAGCLMDTAKNENLAVRWGGEEFILYFPNAEADGIYLVMEELRKRIKDTKFEFSGNEIRITITSGIAAGSPDSNYEKVIASADEKLYLGKARGRNCVIM